MPHHARRSPFLVGLAVGVTLTLAAPALCAQTFALDVPVPDAMHRLGMQTLMDAPIGLPVHISSYSFCHIENDLHILGLSRLERAEDMFGLVVVERRADGSVDVEIPETADIFGEIDGYDMEMFEEDFADLDEMEDERTLTILYLLQTATCAEWGDMAQDPATLLPVASIDGATTMDALLNTLDHPEAEQ